jgi:hypothetical protein
MPPIDDAFKQGTSEAWLKGHIEQIMQRVEATGACSGL